MSEVQEFTTGRGGLFRIPHLPAEPDKIEPGEFLYFFREAWSLNGKSVGDVDRGTQESRQEELIVPPTAEKPIAVSLHYDYGYRPSLGLGGEGYWREQYKISKTSSDVLSFVPQLIFHYSSFELSVGQDSYTKKGGLLRLVACEETDYEAVELSSDHHKHLGELATDFIELVSA